MDPKILKAAIGDILESTLLFDDFIDIMKRESVLKVSTDLICRRHIFFSDTEQLEVKFPSTLRFNYSDVFDVENLKEAIVNCDSQKIDAFAFYHQLAESGVCIAHLSIAFKQIVYLGKVGHSYMEEW